MSTESLIARQQLAFPSLRRIIDERLLRLVVTAAEEFKATSTWIDSREYLVLPLVPREQLPRQSGT